MKTKHKLGLVAAAVLVISVGFAFAQTYNSGLSSLRQVELDSQALPLDSYQIDEGRFARNYRQQPPLIPHAIERYQIDLNANQCLSCHDWTNAGDRQAPTLSMTHYLDRDGNELDVISARRWFCNQCHVPQADAPALVDNDFLSSGKN